MRSAVLNRICANQIDVPVGRVVYTQWLNELGGIEADVTVTRLSETVVPRRDHRRLAAARPGLAGRAHIPEGAHCFAQDVTSGLPMLALMGPKARALLAALSPADLSDAAFPFGTSQEIDLGYARVRASRLTYVGEQGYELYMPAEFAGHVFDRLTAAGEAFGLRMGGYFAINSLRMEKGYRHWGHDIGEEDTPYQAGLGFAVALDKPGGFIGREALVRQKAEGPVTRRLVQLRLDVEGIPPHLYHNEPILRDGAIVGSVTSGAYGHRVGASLGMGYVSHPEGVSDAWLVRRAMGGRDRLAALSRHRTAAPLVRPERRAAEGMTEQHPRPGCTRSGRNKSQRRQEGMTWHERRSTRSWNGASPFWRNPKTRGPALAASTGSG